MFLLRSSAVALLAATTFTLAEQSTKTCIVSGQVVSAATGEPLRSARISLTETGNSKDPHAYNAISDAGGRFSIIAISPGRYKLWAQRNGYVPQPYKPPGGNPGALLELTAGADLRDIVLRLTPAGVIIGRVVDENGDPVAGVQVEALVEDEDGSRRDGNLVVPIRNAVTNDLGEYRLYGLPPGEYFLAAIDTGIPELSEGDLRGDAGFFWQPGAEPKTNHPPLYYPGIFDRTQSQKLKLRGGDEVYADFALRPSKTVNISGRVLGPNGKPTEGVYVTMASRDLETIFSPATNFAQTDSSGRFEVKNLVPGQYTIEAQLTDDKQRLFVARKVEVGNENVNNLELLLTKPFSITGKVITSDSPPPALKHTRVWLTARDDSAGYGSGSAEIKPDGSFTIDWLREGTYSLHILGLGDGWTLRTASFGGDDVFQHGLQVERGTASRSLQITIAHDAAQLEGIVVDGSNPVAGAKVQLEPETTNPFRRDMSHEATTDQNGKFIITNIVPGAYKVSAIAKVADGYLETSVRDSHPDAVMPVTLGARESKTVRVEVKNDE